MDQAALAPARRKLTVHEYHQMAEAGILGEEDRVELIEGDLIDMAPIGQGHAGVVNALAAAFFRACGDSAIVSVQNPVRLDPTSEPQPDVAILRLRADFYVTGDWPGPADVLLLAEVADSSLHYDKTVKLPIYARAGIAEVWIVDLQQRVVEAYRGPSEGSYGEPAKHYAGEQLALVLAPEIVVRLNLMFG